MVVSEKGKLLLMKLEDLRLFPYSDKTGKRITSWDESATIGVGYLIPQEEWAQYCNGITKAQALNLLSDTLSDFEQEVNALVPGLSQTQFDAVCIFVYNIGVTTFKASSALKYLKGGIASKYPSLEAAWKAYNKDDGVVKVGLINRRNTEFNLYTTGVYPI